MTWFARRKGPDRNTLVTMGQPHGLKLNVLASRLAVCRLPPDEPIPAWAHYGEFTSITRTPDELSIVCAEEYAPPDARCEFGWRALAVAGPLEFSLTGVLASLAAPLAQARVSIFAISTFDTDYVLVREANLTEAIEALSRAGHTVAIGLTMRPLCTGNGGDCR
jgi:hypothetical protein